jgi:hypothetical protein
VESAPDIGEILDALHALANADALSGVPKLVAGWRGPNNQYMPHPPQLGARIETTCGRIYKLEAALAKARDVLSRAQRSMERA